jgi:hypothetical protein
MTTGNSGKAGLIVGGGAAILAAIALVKKASAAPGSTFSLDEATRQLLIAIAEANAALVTGVEAILAKMQQTGGGLSGYPVDNAVTLRSITLVLNAVNVAVHLPSLTVPNDMLIVIKADPGNAAFPGVVRIADSQANATDPVHSYPLVTNEFRAVRIKDASNLWVSATVLPASVIVSAEQR